MTEQLRYYPDESTQQVDIPEPHTPASTPEIIFGMDKAMLAHDLLPLEYPDVRYSLQNQRRS